MTVSVIIPVYNGAATVAAAINSALAQRFDGEVEVVAVDDGSTDSTRRVLEGFGSRIKVLRQDNRGPSAARNAGVAASRGEFLAFLDADDTWLPAMLAKTARALEANPGAVLAFSDSLLVTADSGVPERWRVGRAPTMTDLLTRGSGFCTNPVVMRRSVFDACGGFREDLRAFEDLYLWMLARERGEFEYVPEPLVVYRVPPFPVRADKYERGRRTFLRLVRERYGRSARRLIAVVNFDFAASLTQKALAQMDSGNRLGALRTWLRAFRVKPSYFLDPRIVGRAFRPRNLKRLTAMMRWKFVE